MITTSELLNIARARLRDAQVLVRANRFDGAYYLCGYSVELALKVRICKTLKWSGFPEAGQDFKGLQSLKTHDLEVLLKLSGVENRIKRKYIASGSFEEFVPLHRTRNRFVNGILTSSIRCVEPPRCFRLIRKAAGGLDMNLTPVLS